MSLDRPGAMGEVTFDLIVDLVRRRSVQRILQLGSGHSSVRLAAAVEATVISIEHDPAWLEIVRGAAETRAPELVWCPLVPRMFGGYSLVSCGPVPSRGPFDAVIIDGPPYWTLRGREACLYEVYDRVPVGGMIFLDDCFREGERTGPRCTRGSFGVRIERASHGLAILEKVAHVEPRWDAPVRRDDAEAIQRVYAELRDALTAIGSFRRSFWPLDEMARVYGIPQGPPDRSRLRSELERLGEILRPRLDPALPGDA